MEDSLAGAATATATTLLAALWPDSHHILDWRVLAAAAGLGLVAGDDNGLDLVAPGGRDPLPPALDLYSRVRTVLIRQSARADVPLQATEWALYLISKAVNGRGMTWVEYGDKLRKAAQADRAPGADGTSDDECDAPPAAPVPATPAEPARARIPGHQRWATSREVTAGLIPRAFPPLCTAAAACSIALWLHTDQADLAGGSPHGHTKITVQHH